MYTVYHLPQLEKVGCTSRWPDRIEEQGFKESDAVILLKTFDIKEASSTEEFMRKYFKYKPDSMQTYKEKFDKPKTRSFIRGGSTVGLNIGLKTKDDLKEFLDAGAITLGTKQGTYTFDQPEQLDSLLNTAQKSQYPGGDFYWNAKHLDNASNTKNEDIRSEDNGGYTIKEFEQIREWATERGLYERGDSKTQTLKLMEEVGETARAILKSDEPEVKDGLGDILVVLINLSHLCGYKLEDCLAEAYSVISKRKGKMINGTFVKEE